MTIRPSVLVLWSFLAATALEGGSVLVEAFSSPLPYHSGTQPLVSAVSSVTRPPFLNDPSSRFSTCRFAEATTESPNAESSTESTGDDNSGSSEGSSVSLDAQESMIVQALWQQSGGDQSVLQDMVTQTLPTLSPKLIMKLKQTLTDPDEAVAGVSQALDTVLNERLAGGRELLAKLLGAGEIRKLDAEIGKAVREGKMDSAFFSVLNMNLQDALQEAKESDDSEGGEEEDGANRLSILKHISTRCQEEIEKTIPPGVALLNKLLRTVQPEIRQNQLQHYLCPQPDVITLPDGQQIPVKDSEKRKILVEHSDFIEAVGNSVKQVRTVEQAGGLDRESAADMVETFRQLAKEARWVIGNDFGPESKEVVDFEEGLQPVFRPDSAESPYIKGE